MSSAISINYRAALAQTLNDNLQYLAVHDGDPGSAGTSNMKTPSGDILSGTTCDWDETSLGSGVWHTLDDIDVSSTAGTLTWVSFWRNASGTPAFQGKAQISTPIVLSGTGTVTIAIGDLEVVLAYGAIA